GQHFPLAWDPGTAINAENVTDRYKDTEPVAGPRLMVEVKNGSTRVVANVTAVNLESGRTVIQGQSFGPEVDINRHIDALVHPGQEFLVVAELDDKTLSTFAKVDKD